jgi:glycosyltransferase involved in cell wall biosynthesis
MNGLREPLVSVGIPTYNRPDGLRTTLECMLGQTYENLEIIVSDNASTDGRVREVLEEFRERDPRVRIHVQEGNRGSFFNFNWVLKESRGEFFMWAADDDRWEPAFIADCLDEFARSSPETVAVGLEAQYANGDQKYEFFPEGRPFYEFRSDRPLDRMRHMLRHNYGNLFYSLFRRSVLFQDGVSVFDCLKLKAMNEIPLFLFVVQQGNWKVLPKVGIYKSTNDVTYRHARWEREGGRLPPWPVGTTRREMLRQNVTYHLMTLRDVIWSLGRIRLGFLDALRLKGMSCLLLGRHFLSYLFGWKRRAC